MEDWPMSEPLEPNHVEVLIQKYVAGQLTAAEAKDLLRRLQERPALGTEVLDHLRMDEMLSQLIQAEGFGSPVAGSNRIQRSEPRPDVVSFRGISLSRSLAWATALAACLVVLAGVSLRWGSKPAGSGKAAMANPAGSEEEAMTRAVAVLSRTVNVEWATPGDMHRQGEALDPGWLRLKAGVLQVEFFNGARVVLEGPAELQVVSRKEAVCSSGKLSAEAPPSAHGFCIRTPQMNLVDLGTAFGVAVSGSGAEVHVFKGEVEWWEKSAAKQSLKEGEAASVTSGGAIRHFAANNSTFVRATDLDRLAVADQRLRYENWRKASAQLNADPSLVVHFDFEGVGSLNRTLHNLSTNAGAAGDATVVGCSPGQGRWPKKQALEFSGVSSRVLLNVPGEFKSLTYAAWVRVISLDNYFNSLFLCDGFKSGASHWQIFRTGAVRLGVADPNHVAHGEYDTPVIFTPERLGQWTHLAVVYDGDAKQVVHFVNGEEVKRQRLLFETPLRLGPCQLGNWNHGDYTVDEMPIRNLTGRMDEFEIWRRALSDKEIRQVYEAGQPQVVRVERAAN
jgi:hypothetical protein